MLARTALVAALALLSMAAAAPPLLAARDRIVEITGHHSEVWSLQQLGTDGRAIVSSTFDSLVIWDARNGYELRRLVDGARPFHFAVSPDGTRIMIADIDGGRIVDTSTGEMVSEFPPEHSERVFNPAWAADGESIATLVAGQLRLWDSRTLDLKATVDHGAGSARRVSFSPDGGRIAVLGWRGALVVYDLLDRELVARIDAHTVRGGLELEWSPSGDLVATGGAGGFVKLWNARDWTLAHTLQGESGVRIAVSPPDGGPTVYYGLPISATAFSPDGLSLASADQSVRIWSVETGEEVTRWSTQPSDDSYVPHYGRVTDLEFDPSGMYLASSGIDTTMKIWDVRSEAQVANLDSFLGAVELVRWSPDGLRVAIAGRDGAPAIWDLTSRQVEVRFEGHRRGTVVSVDYAPKVPRLVTAGTDGGVHVWHTGEGMQIFDLPPLNEVWSERVKAARPAVQVQYSPASNEVLVLSDGQSDSVVETRIVSTRVGPARRWTSGVRSASYSPDGSRIAAAGLRVEIFDLEDSAASPVVIEPAGSDDTIEVRHVSWSHDGERLLTASVSGAAIWDWRSGRKLSEVHPEGGAKYVEESSDGTLLLTIDGQFRSPRVQTWSLDSQAEVASFDRPGARVAAARFLIGGERVVTSYSRDPVLQTWNALTGRELFQFEAHKGRVLGIDVSQNGHLVATASVDRTARIWDVRSAQEISRLGPRPGAVIGVKFSPDDKQLAAYGVGGVALWDFAGHFRYH